MRSQMHATDPDSLEKRPRTAQPKGCIRIPATLNLFLDWHAILDADYEEVVAQRRDGCFRRGVSRRLGLADICLLSAASGRGVRTGPGGRPNARSAGSPAQAEGLPTFHFIHFK